jgi:hypothetical protein
VLRQETDKDRHRLELPHISPLLVTLECLAREVVRNAAVLQTLGAERDPEVPVHRDRAG